MKNIILLLSTTLIVHWLPAQESGFAPSEGVNIYYRIFGTGEPLLIINGGPGLNSNGFEGLARELAKKYQVILYDQRGTGQSVMQKINDSNMTMDLMVTDLEALRSHLKLPEWVILGHSFGGILVNYYAAKHPDRIKGIIASSSGGVDLGLSEYFDITRQLTPAERDSLNYWTDRIRNGDSTALADQKRREFLASAYLFDKKHIPTIAARLGQGDMGINRLIWQDLERIKYNVANELAGFSKPVLIVQGNHDVVLPVTAQKTAAVFQNSRLVLLDACGHYGWLDQPDQYFRAIDDFMDIITKN